MKVAFGCLHCPTKPREKLRRKSTITLPGSGQQPGPQMTIMHFSKRSLQSYLHEQDHDSSSLTQSSIRGEMIDVMYTN